MNRIKPAALVLALLLLAGGCSVRPRNKTVVLNEAPHAARAGEPGPVIRASQADWVKLEGMEYLGWYGDKVLAYSIGGLYALDPDGGQINQIYDVQGDGLLLSHASLSPEGSRICWFVIGKEGGLGAFVAPLEDLANRIPLEPGWIGPYQPYEAYHPDLYNLHNWSGGLNWSAQGDLLLLPIAYNPEQGDQDHRMLVDATTGRGVALPVAEYLDLDGERMEALLTRYDEDSQGLVLNLVGLNPGEETTLTQGAAKRASLLAEGYVVYQYANTLAFLNRDVPGQAQIYTGVFDYALSPDREWIACAKLAEGSGIDIHVGRVRNGEIIGDAPVFKIGESSWGGMRFSADGMKLMVACGLREPWDRASDTPQNKNISKMEQYGWLPMEHFEWVAEILAYEERIYNEGASLVYPGGRDILCLQLTLDTGQNQDEITY